MPDFESPKLLVARAKENYADFTSKRHAFHSVPRTSSSVETDPYTGEDVYRVRFEGEVPGGIRAAASDTLNNLRHALDQSVYASRAILNPVAKRETYFPICKDEDSLDNTIKTKCFGVHPDIIELIRSFRPFRGGDDLLWSLCRIAGPNKHQLVLGVDISVEPLSAEFHLEVGFGELGGFVRCGDKNEWEIARMAPGSGLSTKLQVTTYITFAQGEVVKGQVVSALLDQHITKTESIVLAIEKETMRIGSPS